MLHRYVNPVGSVLVEIFHLLGLFAIGAGQSGRRPTPSSACSRRAASVEDLLLLFIYLEIGAMVGVYFKTNHMPALPPVRRVTAVTRI